MLFRLLTAILAIAGLTAFAPAPQYKAPKVVPQTLMQRLQGDWEMVNTERTLNGRKVLTKSTSRIRIEGNTWSYLYNNGTTWYTSTSYTIGLDENHKPTHMDLKRAFNGGERVQMAGIVSVEGDTLKFCYSLGGIINADGTRTAPRPNAMNPLPDNAYLMTYKRITPVEVKKNDERRIKR